MLEKCYAGRRCPEDGSIYVINPNGQELKPRLDLVNHSATGEFNWGYGGSGPAQLALAILADYLNDDEKAVTLHQDFKWALVSPIQTDAFKISVDQINDFLEKATISKD